MALVRQLGKLGVDAVDCSSAGVVPKVEIPVGPGYHAAFAARIRRETGVRTCAVGLITGSAQADTIVRSEQADLVVMAREMLRQPHWPLQAARELGRDVPWPPQYERAKVR